MALIVMGCLLWLNTLKYCVVEPIVVNTVSKVRVSVLKDRLSAPTCLLQLLKNSNIAEQLITKINLKAFTTVNLYFFFLHASQYTASME